jgi:hypothetical protein
VGGPQQRRFVITFGEKENDEINEDVNTFFCVVSIGGFAVRGERLHR